MPAREDRHEPCGERQVSLVHDRGCRPPALPPYAGVNIVCRLCRRPEERQGCRLPPTSSRPRSTSPRCPIQQSANHTYYERNQCLILSTTGHENDLSQGRSLAEWRCWHKDCSWKCGQTQSRGDAGGSQSSNQAVSACDRRTRIGYHRIASSPYMAQGRVFLHRPCKLCPKVCRPLSSCLSSELLTIRECRFFTLFFSPRIWYGVVETLFGLKRTIV